MPSESHHPRPRVHGKNEPWPSSVSDPALPDVSGPLHSVPALPERGLTAARGAPRSPHPQTHGHHGSTLAMAFVRHWEGQLIRTGR